MHCPDFFLELSLEYSYQGGKNETGIACTILVCIAISSGQAPDYLYANLTLQKESLIICLFRCLQNLKGPG
jgi:hypothetical protein